jgi:hypothetical protein
MKKQMIKTLSLLLATGFVPALAFTACKSTAEHPNKSGQPAVQQPSSEHPTNAPVKPEHPK